MKKLLTFAVSIAFVMCVVPQVGKAQTLPKVNVIKRVSLVKKSPCDKAREYALKVLMGLAEHCSRPWEALAEKAIDEAFDQCPDRGIDGIVTSCAIQVYEDYAEDSCQQPQPTPQPTPTLYPEYGIDYDVGHCIATATALNFH